MREDKWPIFRGKVMLDLVDPLVGIPHILVRKRLEDYHWSSEDV
jgi:hypothetical protein